MTFERLTPKSSLSPELQTFFCSGCGEVETLDTRDIMFHLILTSISKSLRVTLLGVHFHLTACLRTHRRSLVEFLPAAIAGLASNSRALFSGRIRKKFPVAPLTAKARLEILQGSQSHLLYGSDKTAGRS